MMERFIQIVKKNNPLVKVQVTDGSICMKGQIYIYNSLNKIIIPDNLTVKGSLMIDDGNITKLPKSLVVTGLFLCTSNSIRKIPDDLKASSLSICSRNLKKFPEHMNHFKGSLILDHCKIEKLPDNLIVGNHLSIKYTNIKKLPDNLKVGKTLFLSNTNLVDDTIGFKTRNLSFNSLNAKEISDGLKLRGDLNLEYSEIETLPKNLEIGGDLLLSHCKKLKELPIGLKVGGMIEIDDSMLSTIPEEYHLQKKIRIDQYTSDNEYVYLHTCAKVVNVFKQSIKTEDNPKKREKHFRRLVKENPTNPFAYQELMRCYYLSGNYDKLDETHREALKNDAYECFTDYIVGCSHYQRGDYEVAYQYAEKMVAYFYKEVSLILILNSLYKMISQNREKQFKHSKRWLRKMKEKVKDNSDEIIKSPDLQYYRVLIKELEADLKANRKLTKDYKIISLHLT